MEHVVLMILRKLTPTSFPQQTSVQYIFSGGSIHVVILNHPKGTCRYHRDLLRAVCHCGPDCADRLVWVPPSGPAMPACFCINSLGHGVTQVAWRCTGVIALYRCHGVARVAWRCTGRMALHGLHGVVRMTCRLPVMSRILAQEFGTDGN